MKLIALLLSLCLTFNVLAASGTAQSLERELDEYQYALTVEWDQKDQRFYEAQTSNFFERISHLMKEENLSQSEILSLAERKVSDKKALEALKLRLALAGKTQSEAEMITALKEASSSFYNQGASWNGRLTDSVLLGLAVAAIIGYAIWFDANYQCVAWEEKYECTSTSSTDAWGYPTTKTTCGWRDACVAFEKKQ